METKFILKYNEESSLTTLTATRGHVYISIVIPFFEEEKLIKYKEKMSEYLDYFNIQYEKDFINEKTRI